MNPPPPRSPLVSGDELPASAEGRATLPPPEWSPPQPVKKRASLLPVPVARRVGLRADEATMRAQVEAAREAKDEATERDLSVQLARWLAARERDLDEAIDLAESALRLREDAELRRELAAWLESLGEAARAADALKPLAASLVKSDPEQAASAFVRVGVLAARAGDASGASAAFLEAAKLDPNEALPCELRGTLNGWAPETVSADAAALSFVEAAARREASGASDAQMEDLFRAFEADATSERAAQALADAQIARGRAAAADETWRAHAIALRAIGAAVPEQRGLKLGDAARAVRVHARRRIEALASDDVARALGAAFDEGLDAELEGSGADAMDDLLLRTGLLDALAVRLEVRAERAKPARAAQIFEELGRLYAGPLSSPALAVDAFVAAVSTDPARTESLVALRAHAASKRDPSPLLEALVRVALVQPAQGERWTDRQRTSRVVCARALVQLAEEQLGDSALAAWASERLAWLEPDDVMARSGAARNTARLEAAKVRLETAQQDLAAAHIDAREAPLRTLATILRGMPGEAELHARVLFELSAYAPDDRAIATEAYRLAWRRGNAAEARALAEQQLAHGAAVATKVEARRQLAAAARARGQWTDANEATRPLLDEAPSHRGAVALAWVDAVLAGDMRTRALALEHLAIGTAPATRAVVLGIASSGLNDAGDPAGARRAGEAGCQVDPQSARAVAALADASIGAPDRSAAAALERGIAVVAPRSAWCTMLADALERTGELNYAVAWTQRHVALRPGDGAAIEALMGRVVRARDGARIGEALAWALSQPQPAGALAEHVAQALRELVVLDTDRAVVIARRALDVFGPRHDALRAAMAEVAAKGQDEGFAAALLERWIAAGAPAADRADLYTELVALRSKMGDREGEARALARAIREGHDPRALSAEIQSLEGAPLGPDAELSFLDARAAFLRAGPDLQAASDAMRELGAALWDLTGDRGAACKAWVRAASIAPLRGYAILGADLLRFGDPAFAFQALTSLLEKESDPARSGSIAAEAARAALAVGQPAKAFELASLALERNPALADALEIAERGSIGAMRVRDMSDLYEAVGGRALGRFGRRAAHYRAARFFEQRGEPPLAVKHAAEAFVAVPSEGATFLLLARTAERAGDRGLAIRTIERVAESAGNAGRRASWLLRAATVAGDDEEGARQRVDVLLRATLLAPDGATIALLGDAMRELVRRLPEEREALQLRTARSARALAEHAEGPEGARVAIAMAALSLELFADAEAGFDALARALVLDGDLDEYVKLAPYAVRFGAWDQAEAALEKLMAICERPYANVGAPAMKLLAAIAEAAGDRALYARAIVLAADRDPDDDAIVLAADAAVRAASDKALEARLEKRVPLARRIEALRAQAREKIENGAVDQAIEALDRALEIAPMADRAAIERDLRLACDVAGRSERTEERALRDASDPRYDAAERASRWAEIGSAREKKGDEAGAASAMFEAAVLDSKSIERWSALERIAEIAGRHDLRASALQEIASLVPPDTRIDVLRRLARANDERGEDAAAEANWQEVLGLDPEDDDADHAIESIIVRRGDYAALCDHLARRAERLSLLSGRREALRAVRLRRAAILEQRLNRAQDACDELALLLTESPDNESALCYLADLHERLGAYDRAAPLWRRVAGVTKDEARQCELELRAAAASREAGELETAMAHVHAVLAKVPSHYDALAMRIELARILGDEAELGDALEAMANGATDDAGTRSELLLEAAQAAARAGNVPSSIARAQQAARVSPLQAATQLFARGLEYRLRGSGSPDDARATIEELGRIQGELVADDAALQAFLLAEALDAVQGRGAGMLQLQARHDEIGAHPLLAVGMAERLVSQWKFGEALAHFSEALTGNLLGLRKRGAVALAAADAAMRSEDIDAALAFLDEAAKEPESRSTALRRVAQMAASRGDVAKSRAVLLELARTAQGEDRARTLAQLGRVLFGSQLLEDREEAERIFLEAVVASPEGSVLRAQLQTEYDQLKTRPSQSMMEKHAGKTADGSPSSSSRRAIVVDEPAPARPSIKPGPPVDFVALEREIVHAKTTADRSRAQLALARAHADKGAVGAAETILRDALSEGSAESGELLATLLARDALRSEDLTKVRRRLVDMFPGDLPRLEALRAAALADHNVTYARAIEHVARAFDPGAGPLPPPSLGGQNEHPGMLPFLTRPSQEPGSDALALVSEHGASVFAKSPMAYAITGVERIMPGATSPLARAYELAVRLLDVRRVPLFYKRASGTPSSTVMLVSPPSALVTGDAHEDSVDIRFALGQAIAWALPQHAILFGMPEGEARRVWAAVLGAFGKGELGRGVDPKTAKLAEGFWQTIPQRTQRRLQELLATAHPQDFDPLLAGARQSGRRVALFLTGDFGYTARAMLRERGVDPDEATTDGGLLRLCNEHTPLADLLRLAVSPEYADARWRAVSPQSARFNG